MKQHPVFLLVLAGLLGVPAFGGVIEDFNGLMAPLRSYPGEDVEPDSWRLDSLHVPDSTGSCLRLYGNTWKVEPIVALRLDSGDVWEVAARSDSVGEIQGFGLADSTDTLLYSFAGTEEVDPERWVPVYQGAFPTRVWNRYRLPVAEDWLARFGRLPLVSALVYVNDRDGGPRAVVYFDNVLDITEDLPTAPVVEISYTAGRPFRDRAGRLSVTVRFHSTVTDPDSPLHDYFWRFGDGGTAADSNPVHTYVVEDNHDYSVLLEVSDSTGLWGRAACRVTVDPGPTTFPVRVNFVGDIMLARRYDDPGGIIDSLGVEAIFDPTLPWLGGAADITVANLESPLTAQGTRHPTKPIIFRGRPANVAGLAHAGFDAISLANNHVIDYGLEGMRETQESLAANSILSSGAGANSYEAYQPVFIQQSGVNIAFLRSCDRNGQYDNYQPYLDAGFNKPGFAYLDSFHVREQIRAVEDLADVVVAEFHTGEEYYPTPGEGLDEGDESYSPLAVMPAPGDTEERHRAIEAGADLVVCHHPHMLQGFEVYQGKLIAHSLGDFVFDLNYPETYPTVILNGLVDETGFYDYSLTPAFIDDYIPVRARGELGNAILDWLARRSRDLGTWVAVDRDSVTARILLDTAGVTPAIHRYEARLALSPETSRYVSAPFRLPRNGSISSVVSATPPGTWQYRLGRDLVWFGNFEDEGATMWLLNDTSERYDTLALRGLRSLRHSRAEGTGTLTTNLQEKPPCLTNSVSHTAYASIRTENADSASVAVKLYQTRYSSSALDSCRLGPISGTAGWTFYERDFVPRATTPYFDVLLRSTGPDSGSARVWFDDVGVIEWEPWQTLANPSPTTCPYDYTWVQVRTNTSTDSVLLTYELADFGPQSALSGSRPGVPDFRRFEAFPNPSRSGPLVSYGLSRAADVKLAIFDVTGREVKLVSSGRRSAGRHVVTWDGRDNSGRLVSSGTYFCRLSTDDLSRTLRLVLVR